MSRSGYTDDYDGENWSLICWRGAVKAAMRGKRGQQFFGDIRDAFDAMPVKELAAGSFKESNGCLCTLGVIGAQRGIDLREMEDAADYGNYDQIGKAFGTARALVQEIMWVNDEGNWGRKETPAERWARMRAWVVDQISDPDEGAAP